MKRVLFAAILVIAWLSISGYLLLGSYGNNQASATNPPAIQNSSQKIPVAPSYTPPAYSPPTYSPIVDQPKIQSSQPTPPTYSPPVYSPPTSNYSDSSPAWNYSNSDVDVKGYYRKDGTYVQPYSRTKPDGIKSNNYGYPGNYNPNKGKISK